MAGLFALHKQVLAEAPALQASWKDALRLVQCGGPELANSVSRLESLVSLFNREKDLLEKLLVAKNNQMRTFKFWQLTKQVKTHLKATNIEFLISLLQSTHLQLSSQGKKTKNPREKSFVLAFVWHQLRSHHWIYMDTCALIHLAYDLYCGTVELSHWMPLSLTMMAILSRLHLLCIRFSVILGSVYNSLAKHFPIDDSVKGLLKNSWELWVGELPLQLPIPQEVEWQDGINETNSKNQEAIDQLNRELERANEADDLGEAFEIDEDDSPDISASLLYKPTPSPKRPSSALLASHSVAQAPHTPIPRPKPTDHRSTIPNAPTPTKINESQSKTLKDKSTDETHDKKLKEKRKEKTSSSALSSLVASSSLEKQKSHTKDKHRPKDSSSTQGETKKRKIKSSSVEDEIDDLFGLLTPNIKKQKHK